MYGLYYKPVEKLLKNKMDTFFRTVESSKRLPDKKDQYLTSKGWATFFTDSNKFIGNNGIVEPEWWLEEIDVSISVSIKKDMVICNECKYEMPGHKNWCSKYGN